MVSEIRLSRLDNNLCDLQRKVPAGAFVVFVRYTNTELVAVLAARKE